MVTSMGRTAAKELKVFLLLAQIACIHQVVAKKEMHKVCNSDFPSHVLPYS